MTAAEALTREHQVIDEGIATFMVGLEQGSMAPEPLCRALDALRRHIYIEEAFLFPPLREAGLLMPVLVMLREHGAIWRIMDELTAAASSADACERRDEVLALCHTLADQLDQHNGKEEPIVYPRASSDLAPEDANRLEAVIETGAIPSGWVCQEASEASGL